ncbi:MAG TPA: apolipoprotein N-acyltransferase [Pseudonocardia sp.]|uniref:apolipoprotein N-acyltransferase n=1 Tax=Pseudonocardia sp. TaxID=60912 RepID=UPI002D03CAAF|nr:apolipoprotein N-acyltransferase [Pseudonocardia sp.]HTF52729.1 apolipoprotein N-acyltransferase [Pseudonocardia sp.]
MTSTPASPSTEARPRLSGLDWRARLGGPRWWESLARLLAAPVGGVLLYLACAPRTAWWLAPIAFALLGAVLRGRRWRTGLGLGVLFGLGYFVPLLPWIGIYVGALPWLALATLEAVFLGVGCGLIAVASRLPAAPVWAAMLWVATEAGTSRFPFGGFPWGKVAFSQADGPFARLAALGGAPLVGFAVVLTGFALAELVRRLLRRYGAGPLRAAGIKPLTPAGGAPPSVAGGGSRRGWVTPTACLVLPVLVALLIPAWLTGAGGPPARTVTVAAVQGNVPRLGLDFNAQRRAVLDYHVRRTLQLADDITAGRVPHPDLVIWPENSSDIDPLLNSDAYAEISAVVDRLGVPVLVGAVLVQPDDVHTTNTALVWAPGVGPVERNDKRRVQPFGEYLPWRSFFRLLSPYADKAGNFVPGHGPGVVQMAGIPVGVAICWEIAFDDLVNDSVHNGAQLLAVPSNNATFGLSEMTYQQLAMSRLAAVEHDRAVVVAATSGVSAIIAPDGSELARTPVFAPAALVERVPLRTTTTLATRLGAVPEWILTAAGLVAFGVAWRRRTAGVASVPPDQPENT